MKKGIVLAIAVLSCVCFLVRPLRAAEMGGMDNGAQSSDEKTDINASQATLYTCPMHPEIQSDKSGKCPKCGMRLVKKDKGTIAGKDMKKGASSRKSQSSGRKHKKNHSKTQKKTHSHGKPHKQKQKDAEGL